MCDILIFGGTTEGRKLAEFCEKEKIPVFVSVATDYGETVLTKSSYIKIIKGRMSVEDMGKFIIQHHIQMIIDATHPYAVEVTKNIQSVCEKISVENIRVCREHNTVDNYAKFFPDKQAVIDYLNTKDGNIFLTTGSKEAEIFTKIQNYQSRCVIRILPYEENIQHCQNLGFENIIAERPSFSVEENIALIHKYNIKFLVTKDSGKTGGFDSKLQSAKECDIECLVIRRPKDSGLSLETVKSRLWEKYYE